MPCPLKAIHATVACLQVPVLTPKREGGALCLEKTSFPPASQWDTARPGPVTHSQRHGGTFFIALQGILDLKVLQQELQDLDGHLGARSHHCPELVGMPVKSAPRDAGSVSGFPWEEQQQGAEHGCGGQPSHGYPETQAAYLLTGIEKDRQLRITSSMW